MRPPFLCAHPTGAVKSLELAFFAQLESFQEAERQRWVRRFRQDHEDDPVQLLAFSAALNRVDPILGQAADEIVEWTLERHSEHPATATARATRLASGGQWDEVRRVIDGLDLGSADERTEMHLRHLLGVALAWLGEARRARSVWKTAARMDGRCDLEACLQLVTPLPARLRPGHWGPDKPLVRQLMGAVRVADAAMARGDVAAAIEAVDRRTVWQAAEVQALARLAEAYLLLDDPVAWFQKFLVLATFRNVFEGRADGRLREIPYPGATWDRSRLDDLDQRCAAWLESG